ncbi:MAG: phage holin family protein [Clostridia bacterium]|nr:phage holin family protein [Clostridia bacterium]
MEILTYITDNAFIMIPVLLVVGQMIKNIDKIADKWIPLILLPVGILGAMALGSWTVDNAIQGVLVTGVAVYGNQVVKQMKKTE